MTISAGVDNKNLAVAVKAIIVELAKLKEMIPEVELSKAKELFKGRIMLRMEDSRSVSGWMGSQEILTGEILTVEEVIAAVEAITAAELKRVAGEIILGDKLHLAAVGPLDPDGHWEDLLKF
jgi:predicted Zn-dependent peptidase